MSVTTRFTAQDDLLHDVDPDLPHGRESFAWAVPLPQHGLQVFLYMGRDSATGLFSLAVGIADAVSLDPLYRKVDTGLELRDGTDFDDCRIGGLHLRQPEPLTTAHLRYEDGETLIDVQMRALHRPFSWHENDDGCPEWVATDRFEQSVSTEGVIEVAGRRVEFSSFGHRDHSWGPRDWRPMHHWKWMNAATQDGSTSIHAFEIFGLADRRVMGYVNRDGDVTPITEIATTTELDFTTLMHTHTLAECTDAEGRVIVLDATSVAGLPIPGGHMRMNEISCTGTLGGEPADIHVEMGWAETYAQNYDGGGDAA
jgi:hypothetical protein